ncbi:hypothetical protein HN933_02775 [Candidatus Woesearchaeota archaeon]|nr:hypothetical protein [Candidatus Woesearchaeota archaeon]
MPVNLGRVILLLFILYSMSVQPVNVVSALDDNVSNSSFYGFNVPIEEPLVDVCSSNDDCSESFYCSDNNVCEECSLWADDGICCNGERGGDCGLDVETNCQDGTDNDNDYFTDCEDADCILNEECQCSARDDCWDGTYCSDSLCVPCDEDEDDWICCQGEDLKSADCQSEDEVERICDDLRDNDFDGEEDCDDDDCVGDINCFELPVLYQVASSSANPLIEFVSPTPDDGDSQSVTTVEVNVSIIEEDLDSLIYNWNGTNHTMYNDSLVLMMNLDDSDEQEVINASFSMTNNANAYHYEDLSSVTDYVIQSGDYVEYDIYWTSSSDEIAFDYTNSDATELRSSGVDQNGLSSHPSTDISAYALNKWYHRTIALPVSHVGKTIQYYDVVCEADSTGTYTGYLDNIVITDGAGTVRKEIYTSGDFTNAVHLQTSGSLNSIGNVSAAPLMVVDNSISDLRGTVIGASFNSSGKYSGGYDFDGVDDVIFNSDAGLDFGAGDDYTISVWISTRQNDTGRYILGLGNDGSSSGTYTLETSVSVGGNISFAMRQGSVGDWFATASSVSISEDDWHYVVWVNDGSQVKTYIDGLLSKTDSLGSFVSHSLVDNYLRVGTTIWQNAYFNGSIDEVRIWDVALSSEDVYQQYVSNLNKFNSSQWYLYVNQSKNATDDLNYGGYTYQVFVEDGSSNSNETDVRSVSLLDSSVEFVSPTLSNGSSTINTSVEVNVSIVEGGLSSVVYNWNGTNYTMYDDSLILMYNFDNVSSLGENNTNILDLSGNENNGTFSVLPDSDSGPDLSGKHDGGFEFDASGDYVDCGNDVSLRLTDPMTIELWFNWDGSSSNSYILSKGSAGSGGDGYHIWLDSTLGEYLLTTQIGNRMNKYDEPTPNVWHNVVVVDNGTNKITYYDGDFLGSAATDSDDDINDNLIIGASSTSQSNGFDGHIDEVRIWNRSLTANEVYQQYVSNLNKFSSTQWYLYVNQSKNATDELATGDYTYQVFVEGVSNLSTEERSLSVIEPVNSSVSVSFVTPSSNANATRARMYRMAFNVTCTGQEDCGDVNVTLDSDNFYFFDNFDTGAFVGDDWTTYSSDGNGYIDVNDTTAYSGGYSVLANVADGSTSVNELITGYDFTGHDYVYLDFYWRESDDGDELNLGGDHSGQSHTSDAVYYTCDGTLWYHLMNAPESFTSWTQQTINVTVDPDFCGTLDENFKIKFTQYDNTAWPNDGMAWDDIRIDYTPRSDGVLSTTNSSPFWTNSSTNPVTLSSMSAGESREIEFWVNVTGSSDDVYKFFAHANITYDESQSNTSEILNITIVEGDYVAPTWSLNKTNLSDSTSYGDTVYFNITVNESSSSQYIFSFYNGTGWVNDSAVNYTDGEELSVLKNITGSMINWTWYFNDTEGNSNQSDVWGLLLDAVIGVEVISPSGNVNVTQNLGFDVVVNVSCSVGFDCGDLNVTLDPESTTVYNFTTCTSTGRSGPSQGNCDSEYSNTTLESLVTVSSGIQNWTVPFTGSYTIVAVGAAGGGNSYPGRGALVNGTFYLNAGQVVQILVGQRGDSATYGSGGGGGTYVVYSNNTPLVVAGAGGGAYSSSNDRSGYSDASNETAGRAGEGTSSGGTSGSGGSAGASGNGGSGGGGLTTDGDDGRSPSTGGLAFVNGGTGGTECTTNSGDGGFGGGAGGEHCYYGSAGGGGGYSGGGGGGTSSAGAGGGGSYNGGAGQYNVGGYNTGQGYVTIILTAPIKTGVVSTNTSATPFYTNKSSNPYNISLSDGESELVTFWVNATGYIETTHEFFVYVNRTEKMSNSETSSRWNVTIKPVGAPLWYDNKTNLTSSFDLGQDAYFNISANDTSPSEYIFSFYNGTDWINDTSQGFSSGEELSVVKNITSSPISWTWYFNDTEGNSNQSEVWTVVLDSRIGLSLIYPTNHTNVTQNEFFNVTVNVSCDSLVPCREINVSLDPLGTPVSCKEILDIGQSQGDGIYTIYPFDENSSSIEVYCDMTTDSGGWTMVFASQGSSSTHKSTWAGWFTEGYTTASVNQTSQGKSAAYDSVPVDDLMLESTYSTDGMILAHLNVTYDALINLTGPNPGPNTGGAWNTGLRGSYDSYNRSGSYFTNDWIKIWHGDGDPEANDRAVFSTYNPAGDWNNDIGCIGGENYLAGPADSEWYYIYVRENVTYEAGKGGLISTNISETPFYTNKSSNPYNISLLSGESQIVTFYVNATGDGTDEYEFFVFANKTSRLSNSNITSTWNVTIDDDTTPSLDYESPTLSNGTYPNDWIAVNVSSSDSHLANIVVGIYNTTGGLVTSSSDSSSPFFVNFTNLTDATYYVNATAIDTADNTNSTETRQITLDTTPPAMSFVSPTPANNTRQPERSFLVNASINEFVLDYIYYDWNGTNHTFWNDSLVLMYNFDNVSALGENDSYVVDVSDYGNDGVVNGSVFNLSGGKYGGAFDFDGVDDSVEIESSSSLNISGNITLSVWVNINNLSNDFSFLSKEDAFAFHTSTVSLDELRFTIPGLWDSDSTDADLEIGRWHHLTVTYDRTNVRFYSNGVLVGVSSKTDAIPSNSNPIVIGEDQWVGAGSSYFNGTIDEVRIWNRSLTADEVYIQYVSNLNKYGANDWYFYVNQSLNATDDLVEGNYTYNLYASDIYGNLNNTIERLIIVDWTEPEFTNFSNQTVEHAYGISYDINASDENDVSCFAVNNTNFSITCSGVLTNATELSNGVYWLNITINDTANNNFSNVMWVNVTDTIPPYFVNITNSSYIANVTHEYGELFTFDVNATDSNNVSCFTVDDTTNFTINCSGYLQNNTWLAVGFYLLNITSNDTVNNVNWSLMWVNITDTTAPALNITYPLNNTFSNDGGLDINYSVYDLNLDSCWYRNNTGEENITLVGCENITSILWPESYRNITVWANDTYGNVNTSMIYLTLDRTSPVFINFTNQTIYEDDFYGYQINSSDYVSVSCFSLNDTSVFDVNCSGFISNVTEMNQSIVGLYWLNVTINDSSGNENYTLIWINVTDKGRLNLEVLYPTTHMNASQFEMFNVTINVSCIDNECGNVNVTLDPESGTIYNFTSCGVTGRTGPLQASCDSVYADTLLDGDVQVYSGIQNWTVPQSGTYIIEAAGAKGGCTDGGDGAVISGEFDFVGGEVLQILVGQKGVCTSYGGGGGGTFVAAGTHYSDATPLVVAGGGGGDSSGSSSTQYGKDGVTGINGTDGWNSAGNAGTNGNGAGKGTGSFSGSGGAGYYGSGVAGSRSTGGVAFILGGAGGTASTNGPGGFGGGGGNGWHGGGGAGGYSGGGGGYSDNYAGGGGGSYNNGTNQNNSEGANSDDGYVTISRASGKGTVSMNTSATPFYTTVQNPYMVNLSQGDSQVITWYVNTTGGIETEHEFFVYADRLDDLTIRNTSEIWNVTIIDTTSPVFNYTDNLTLEYNYTWSYDVNASDYNDLSCFTVDDGNFTINCSGVLTNNTFLELGMYILNITVNDTSNNLVSEFVTVNVTNTTLPVFTDLENLTKQYGPPWSNDFDAYDISGIDCFSVNDTAQFTINCTGYLTNASSLNESIYWINLTVNDTIGNENYAQIYVNITNQDVTVPNVTIDAPSRDALFNYSTTLVQLNVTTDENTTCYYSLDNGTTNYTMSVVVSNTSFTSNLSVEAGNDYTANVYCFDWQDNWNNSEYVDFTVDAPEISLEIITPSSSEINVSAGQMFEVVVNVSCVEMDCGAINVSLDPVTFDAVTNGDFETNDFTGWSRSGDANWSLQGTVVSSGNYSAETGAIGHSEYSLLTQDVTIYEDTNLSFMWKVSSESSYDYLGFCVDLSYGVAGCRRFGDTGYGTVSGISGTVDWTQVTYELSAGTHTLLWYYAKDSGSVGGSDQGWVDNVTLVSNAPVKSGLISMDSSAVPFFTNTTNPYNISLSENESTLVSYWVNATGYLSSEHEFFVYANTTDFPIPISDVSSTWNVTILDLTNPSLEFGNDTTDAGMNNLVTTITVNVSASDLYLDTLLVNVYNSTGLMNSTSDSYIQLTDLPYGTYYVNVTATDTSGNVNITSRTIVLARPYVGISVVYPPGSTSVSQYYWFNVTLNVSCTGADCGDVNVTLDPLSGIDCGPISNCDFSLTGDCSGADGTCTDIPGWTYYEVADGTYERAEVSTATNPFGDKGNWLDFKSTYGGSRNTLWKSYIYSDAFLANADYVTYNFKAYEYDEWGYGLMLYEDGNESENYQLLEYRCPYTGSWGASDEVWGGCEDNNIYQLGTLTDKTVALNDSLKNKNLRIKVWTGDGGTGDHGEAILDDVCLSYSNGVCVSSDKGTISTVAGTVPFYTNMSTNPYTINLNESESQIVTFFVNATGRLNTSYDFFAYAEVGQDTSIRNDTEHWNVTILDLTAPVLHFVSPSHSAGYSNGSVILANVTATDYYYVNMTVFLYNDSGVLYSNFTTDDQIYLEFTNLSDGVYYLNASSAVDESGNVGFSETRTIYLDNDEPGITLYAPDDEYITGSSSIDFVFNLTEDSTANCSVYRDVEASVTYELAALNESVQPDVNTTVTATNFSGREYSWYVSCIDEAGNTNVSETRTLTVDTVGPVISIESPAYNETVGYQIYVTTDIVDALSNVSSGWYFVYNGTDTSQQLANGTLNDSSDWDSLWDSSGYPGVAWDILLVVYANDTLGNVATNNVSFNLDNARPVMQYVEPTSALKFYNSNFTMNVIVQDNSFNYTYYNITSESSGATIQYNSSAYGSPVEEHIWNDSFDVDGNDDGYYNLTVYGRDIVPNAVSTSVQFVLDQTSPVVVVYSPESGQFIDNSSVVFNWTVSDNISTSLLCNVTVGQVVQQVICDNGSGCDYTFTNFGEDFYNFSVVCRDNASNAITESGNFTIDRTSPVISFVSPSTSADNLSQDYISMNVTASDLYLDAIVLDFYNSSLDLINTTNTTSGVLSLNVSGLSEGLYYVNATANDSYGHVSATGTRAMFLDVTNPLVSVWRNASSLEFGEDYVMINWSVAENNVNNVVMNVTLASGYVIYNSSSSSGTVNLTDVELIALGTYTISLYAEDDAGNSNITTTTFAVDDTRYPDVNFMSPDTGNYSRDWVYARVNSSDSGVTTLIVRLYNSTGGLVNTSEGGENPYSANFTSLVDGVYYYNATACDDTRCNSSNTLSLEIDDTAPLVAFESDTTSSGDYAVDYVYANVSASDMRFDSIAVYLYNSSGDLINSTLAQSSSLTYNFSSLLDGDYFMNASANDTLSNKNYTETRNYTIDSTTPSIDYASGAEADGVYRIQSWIYVNVSASDANEANITFSLYNSSEDVLSSQTKKAGIRTINFSSLSDGLYYYNVSVLDTVGNLNYTSTRSIILDSVNPSLSIVSPSGGANVVDSGLDVEFNVSDTNLDSCWYSNDTMQSNYTLTNCSNITSVVWGEGNHNVTVWVNDSAGAVNSSTVSFTLDSIVPAFTDIGNVTIEYETALGYDINATDANGIGCFSVDDTSNFAINCSGYLINNTLVSSGQHWINVTVNDTFGNTASNLMWVNVSGTVVTVNVLYPLTTSYTSNVAVLNYSVSGDEIRDKCWYSLDNGSTNSSLISAGVNFTSLTSSEGSNTWTVYCNDTYDNQGTDFVTFFKDSVAPAFTAMGNQTIEVGSSLSYDINASDVNGVSCFVVNDSDFSINCSGYLSNATGLSLGTYWLDVTINDSYGNENTNTMSVTVEDSVAPVITVIENQTVEYGVGLGYDLNATDAQGVSCFAVNDSDFSINCSGYLSNATLLGVGLYWLNVTVNDTSDNEAYGLMWVNVTDTTAPVFTAIDNQTVEVGSIFNYDVNATDANAVSCFAVDDGNFSINCSGYLSNATGLVTGVYTLNISVNDTSSNDAYGAVWVNVTDTVSPSISVVYPLNNTMYLVNVTQFNYSVSDLGTLDSCWYDNGSVNSSAVSAGQNFTNVSNLQGWNNLTIYCNDSLNNFGNDSVRFLMDTVAPNVTLNSPADSYYNGSAPRVNLTFNCSVEDNYQLSNVSLYITNALNTSFGLNNETTVGGAVNESTWNLTLTHGNYTWACFVEDFAGNSNWSENRSIMINFTDVDNDDIKDDVDNLIGTEINVNTTGVDDLNITVDGNATNGTYGGLREVVFYDESDAVINFTHNFTNSTLDLRDVTLIVTDTYVIINMSGQLQANKTLYITDNSFISLCVKDEEVAAISAMSSGCAGSNETDFTDCLGANLTTGNLTCTDLGSTIMIEGLENSAVRGTQAAPSSPAASSDTSSGSSGKSQRRLVCGDGLCSDYVNESCSNCPNDCGVCKLDKSASDDLVAGVEGEISQSGSSDLEPGDVDVYDDSLDIKNDDGLIAISVIGGVCKSSIGWFVLLLLLTLIALLTLLGYLLRNHHRVAKLIGVVRTFVGKYHVLDNSSHAGRYVVERKSIRAKSNKKKIVKKPKRKSARKKTKKKTSKKK